MGPRYMSTTFVNNQEEAQHSPENNGESRVIVGLCGQTNDRLRNIQVNGPDTKGTSQKNSRESPQSSMLKDYKTSSSSPKKSKRSIEKRVVSVSMKNTQVSRIKGEMGAPPSDSWAWRKYGQKPIKGSPYPRAYYRCSSSKGCPARKRVERSRLDAKMLTVTYSYEHNHPWSVTRSGNRITSSNSTSPNVMTTTNSEDCEEKEECHEKSINSSDDHSKTNPDENKFCNFGEGANNYGLWFSDHFESTECSFFTTEERMMIDSDMDMAFPMKEEDESFFADLGELPESSSMFGGRTMERKEEHRQVTLTPWCGTTT